MKISHIFKLFVPLILTYIGIEIGSNLIAYQLVNTSWRKIHHNGLISNIENGSAIHETWVDIKKKYLFGKYANRISLDSRHDKQKSCKYLILGDSYTFGWLVDYEEAFPSLLNVHFNKNNDKLIEFINASAGGWGIADYPAYLEIYKDKLSESNLDGIIIFINHLDASRAAKSDLYITVNEKDLLSARRSNKRFNSKEGIIKRFLSIRLISFFYDASQRYSNTARLIKNFLLDGNIMIDPRKNVSNPKNKYLSKEKIKELKSPKPEEIVKIKQAVTDLSKLSNGIAPLNLVYTGVFPEKFLNGADHYFLSGEGRIFLASKNIKFDFSTLKKNKKLYSSNSHQIEYDEHPNSLGHAKIADHLLNSSSTSSINNFINATCIAKNN